MNIMICKTIAFALGIILQDDGVTTDMLLYCDNNIKSNQEIVGNISGDVDITTYLA